MNWERRTNMKKAGNYISIFLLAILLSACPLKSASAHGGEYHDEGYRGGGYQVGGYFSIWGGYTIAPDLSSGYYDDGDYYKSDINLDIDETSVFGAKLGFSHPMLRALAFELEYSYLNPDITDYSTVAGDIKFNNFMFNIIARIPVGVIHPYWGAGFGFSHYDISAKDEGSGTENNTSYAWQLLTGLEIDLTPNLAVDVGYRYFVTELKFENYINSEYKNSTDVDFTTSMITLGVKFRF
jgi:opacity protein-like surface antigen